jgi:hypothetical protein
MRTLCGQSEVETVLTAVERVMSAGETVKKPSVLVGPRAEAVGTMI